MDSVFVVALIVALLILLNGVCVAAEFALVSVSRANEAQLANRGQRLAGVLRGILRDQRQQDRYIATTQIGVTLASLGLVDVQFGCCATGSCVRVAPGKEVTVPPNISPRAQEEP